MHNQGRESTEALTGYLLALAQQFHFVRVANPVALLMWRLALIDNITGNVGSAPFHPTEKPYLLIESTRFFLVKYCCRPTYFCIQTANMLPGKSQTD